MLIDLAITPPIVKLSMHWVVLDLRTSKLVLFCLQSDKVDKSGFDIILAKHINGKTVIKDVIEFMKER